MPRSETLVYREGYGCVTKDVAAGIDAKKAIERKADARSTAFDCVSVERGSWVFRNGELVERESVKK